MEFTPQTKSASHGIATPLAGGHSRAELNVRTRRKRSHGAWYSTNATTTRHCVQDRERGQEKVHFAGCGRGHELALHGFYEVSMQLLDARTRRRASIRGEHGVRTKADQAPKPHPCDTPARSAQPKCSSWQECCGALNGRYRLAGWGRRGRVPASHPFFKAALETTLQNLFLLLIQALVRKPLVSVSLHIATWGHPGGAHA